MTYSLVGRCRRTGQLGGVVTTSSPAVGSRCLFARGGVGAALTQNWTDPRIGPELLDAMARGLSAGAAMALVTQDRPFIGVRQLAAIDAAGRTAWFSGDRITSQRSEAEGRDCVAVGNILANAGVAAEMVAAFEADPDLPLAERLLAAIAAGDAAGGELRPIASAALQVVAGDSFPYLDLRVDDHSHPVAELYRLHALIAPLADGFALRATAPY